MKSDLQHLAQRVASSYLTWAERQTTATAQRQHRFPFFLYLRFDIHPQLNLTLHGMTSTTAKAFAGANDEDIESFLEQGQEAIFAQWWREASAHTSAKFEHST